MKTRRDRVATLKWMKSLAQALYCVHKGGLAPGRVSLFVLAERTGLNLGGTSSRISVSN
jgi:hypothetical protein